jgi:hypothetical protein
MASDFFLLPSKVSDKNYIHVNKKLIKLGKTLNIVSRKPLLHGAKEIRLCRCWLTFSFRGSQLFIVCTGFYQ